jgi:hypothetical protein
MKTSIQPAILSPWQAAQAAMLYHYASIERLRQLHLIITQLINGIVDPLLDLAKLQGRDRRLVDERWGNRDTSENWANNAWPFLKDLQKGLACNIALRSQGEYRETGTDHYLRGADQFSMMWASDEEEARFEAAVNLISRYAGLIDNTLAHPQNRWDDYVLMYHFADFVSENPTRPIFKVRTEIVSETGEIPPRAGVYVSADDPFAALQFAWPGRKGCPLRYANTFNPLGLAALSQVGRSRLWVDEARMFDFATRSEFANELRPQLEVLGTVYPTFAPSVVARAAFEQKPSKWYFVEQLDEPWVATKLEWNDGDNGRDTVRLAAGDICSVSGYYYSPSRQDSRRFIGAGEVAPDFGSDYGTTIWQLEKK